MKYLLILLFGVLTSCISDEESRLQTNSPYQGNWYGIYTGILSGTISFKVNKSGNLDGMVYQSSSNSSEVIEGYVDPVGRIDLYSKNGFTIHGVLVNNQSSGEWSQQRGNILYKGNYSIKKE